MIFGAFGSKNSVKEQETVNPFSLPEKVEEPVEELSLDEILGSAASTHFTSSSPQSSTGLYPVAGGVGLSTLVNASLGGLQEPTGSYAHVILVATTAADHLLKAAALLRKGHTPEGADIIGVVLVHDRPKLSKPSIAEGKKVVRMATHGWVVPYIPALREPGEPVTKFPKRFQTVVTELSKMTVA